MQAQSDQLDELQEDNRCLHLRLEAYKQGTPPVDKQIQQRENELAQIEIQQKKQERELICRYGRDIYLYF